MPGEDGWVGLSLRLGDLATVKSAEKEKPEMAEENDLTASFGRRFCCVLDYEIVEMAEHSMLVGEALADLKTELRSWPVWSGELSRVLEQLDAAYNGLFELAFEFKKRCEA